MIVLLALSDLPVSTVYPATPIEVGSATAPALPLGNLEASSLLAWMNNLRPGTAAPESATWGGKQSSRLSYSWAMDHMLPSTAVACSPPKITYHGPIGDQRLENSTDVQGYAFAAGASSTREGVLISDSRLMSPVWAQLERLRELPPNWDGHGASTPADQAIDRAKELLGIVLGFGPDPDVEFAGDGEISFVWQVSDTHFEIGIDNDGGVSFFGQSNDSHDPIYGELDGLPTELPPAVLEFLMRFRDAGRLFV